METTAQPVAQTKKAAMNGLAVVGFVALIIIGILTAIYAATFIPKALSRFATANVYLSNLTSSQQPSELQAVTPTPAPTYTAPAATTSIPLSPVVTTPTPTATTPVTPTVTKPTVTYTKPTYTVVQVPTATNYSGLPDLTVSITDSGYLSNGNIDSFVSSSYVPQGYRGAVRYTIANRGTNISGPYNVLINVSTNDGNDSSSVAGSALPPNRTVVGTGVFDTNNSSGSANVRLTVDSYNAVNESNESNNVDSVTISLRGGNSNTSNGSYDSNGNYCANGTYYSGSRYYCNTSNNNNSNNTSTYDSNGNYCSYGTYLSGNRYYCNTSSTNTNSNNGSCQYGSYLAADGTYKCYVNYYYNRNPSCTNGSYYQNGSYYCY